MVLNLSILRYQSFLLNKIKSNSWLCRFRLYTSQTRTNQGFGRQMKVLFPLPPAQNKAQIVMGVTWFFYQVKFVCLFFFSFFFFCFVLFCFVSVLILLLLLCFVLNRSQSFRNIFLFISCNTGDFSAWGRRDDD